jgi:hypothetical protein
MSQSVATAMSARNQVSALSREVTGLLVKAMTEATTSSGVNGIQGQTLLTSIEDAIFEIDSSPSEVQESESLLQTEDAPTVFASGTLPVRQARGKLQRIRALRSALYGPTPSEPGAIEALKKLLNEWD